jgi:INO80 complex subunit C
VNRRAKNVKNVLTQERERERAGRERVWRAREERMHVDAEGGEEIAEEDVITCEREL